MDHCVNPTNVIHYFFLKKLHNVAFIMLAHLQEHVFESQALKLTPVYFCLLGIIHPRALERFFLLLS